VVNATVLLEATGEKVREFLELVRSTEPKPHMIIVHKVNGFSGDVGEGFAEFVVAWTIALL